MRSDMGKILNFVPTNLFRRKNTDDLTKTNLEEVQHNNDVLEEEEEEEEEDMSQNKELVTSQENSLQCGNKTPGNIDEKVIDENVNKRVYELERSYIFEQNNIIERVQEEKTEMVESFKLEKIYMKRAFENEKIELLKQIERNEKMLFGLSKVLKEEYLKNLEKEKENILYSKTNILNEIEAKLKIIIFNLNEIFENNENAFNKLDEFKIIQDEYKTFLSLKSSISETKLSQNDNDNVDIDSVKSDYSELHNEPDLSQHAELDSINGALSELLVNKLRISSKVKKRKEKPVCDICINNRKHVSKINSNDETVIQHELAQAYRKQKSELLKLFSAEKEEFEAKLTSEKKKFEKEIRLEYESRTSVERKAWQETIEDYEREVAILKYEREQMDRNYCIGMDEMKTEFEKEKMSLHRRYSETHEHLKRSLSEKINMELMIDNPKTK